MVQKTWPIATLVIATLLVGLGVATCGADDWPVQGNGAPGIDESINGDVLEFLGENDLPGATVAVTRSGRLVWSKGYGWASEAEQIRMKPWHRSRIGSTSKVITAIGMLQMLESEGSAIGGLATGPSQVSARLTQKVYGHPGGDFHSQDWPNVTEATVLDNPEWYWQAIRGGVQDLFADTYETDMARMIEWASSVELGYLLSHTSGLVRSSDKATAAAYFGVDESELTYSQVHAVALMAMTQSREDSDDVKCYENGESYVDSSDPDFTGKTYQMPPLLFEPGTDSCYSNHAFALLGHIVDEWAGPGEENTYHEAIRRTILQPLGVTGVVANNSDISELDAWPHGSELDPENPSVLLTATGGWSASAQDMVRIMCGLDRTSNHLRLLRPETVTIMETVAYPAADSNQPLGWDSHTGQRLYKNGSVGGGKAVIIKYLPGEFGEAPDDEINIAFNVNSSGKMPPVELLRDIAQKVAAADMPEDYDLFDPAHACFVKPELGFANPGASPSPTPQPGVTLVAPTTTGPTGTRPSHTTPKPPTVIIRQPKAGRHEAPGGKASLTFSGLARDAKGTLIPGSNYRWTAIQGKTRTLLCAGSGIGTASPTAVGGLTTSTDCTSFTKGLANPDRGSSPPITILLEARDSAGTIGSATVTITLYTA